MCVALLRFIKAVSDFETFYSVQCMVKNIACMAKSW